MGRLFALVKEKTDQRQALSIIVNALRLIPGIFARFRALWPQEQCPHFTYFQRRAPSAPALLFFLFRIEVFESASGQWRQVALFPEDRPAPELAHEAVHVRLDQLQVRRPRQRGAGSGAMATAGTSGRIACRWSSRWWSRRKACLWRMK